MNENIAQMNALWLQVYDEHLHQTHHLHLQLSARCASITHTVLNIYIYIVICVLCDEYGWYFAILRFKFNFNLIIRHSISTKALAVL